MLVDNGYAKFVWWVCTEDGCICRQAWSTLDQNNTRNDDWYKNNTKSNCVGGDLYDGQTQQNGYNEDNLLVFDESVQMMVAHTDNLAAQLIKPTQEMTIDIKNNTKSNCAWDNLYDKQTQQNGYNEKTFC